MLPNGRGEIAAMLPICIMQPSPDAIRRPMKSLTILIGPKRLTSNKAFAFSISKSVAAAGPPRKSQFSDKYHVGGVGKQTLPTDYKIRHLNGGGFNNRLTHC